MPEITREMLWADSGETVVAAVVAHASPDLYHVYRRDPDQPWELIAATADHKRVTEWWRCAVDPAPVHGPLAEWLDEAYADLTGCAR